MVGVGYIFTISRQLATFCHAFCMAASNYRVVCNLHAIMVYNAEAPLDSLYGHPVQLQLPFLYHPSLSLPLSLSLSLSLSLTSLSLYLSLCYSTKTKTESVYTFHRATPVSRRLITPAWTLFHINLRCIREKKNYEYFRNPLSILSDDRKSFQDPITMLRM